MVKSVEMPLGCVDITDVEGNGRGEHSSVGVLGVDRDGVLDEGPGGVDVPLEAQEPRLVREGLRVGGRQLEDVVVHVDCGVEITFPEQLLRFEQELSGGDPDIAGDRVVECPTAGELGDENPGEGGNDGDAGQPHPAGSLRRRCLDRCGLLPRLDCSKHPSGAGGVVSLQRFVVSVVEIAGGVLGLEIVERPEQEVTLLAERRIDAHPRSAIACSTNAWSSSVASRSASRCHRRNTRPRPVTATAPPTTGRIHTRAVTPSAEGV